jgi:ribosomal protein S18 acetylase RimI-like enzyme
MLIRPSRQADAQSMAHVYVKTWQDTYLGLVPFGYLYEMSASALERGFLNETQGKHAFSYVADDAGDVIGFISGGYARQADDIYEGEIFALYVLKNHQRKGIGTQLVLALATAFNRCDIHSMLVWVLEHNPCRRFYERLNGMYLRKKRLPFAGELLDTVAYGWIDTSLITL